MTKKISGRNIFVAVLVLAAIVIALFTLAVFLFKPSIVRKDSEDRMARIFLAERINAETGAQEIAVYRLKNRETETFTGFFGTAFSREDEVIFFGRAQTEPPGTMGLYVMTSDATKTKDISGIPGPLINVFPDPTGKYLLLAGQKTGGAEKKETGALYSCIVPKDRDNYGECLPIQDALAEYGVDDSFFLSFWAQSIAPELVMQEINGEQRRFAYRPDSNETEVLSAERAKELESVQTLKENQGGRSVRHFGPLFLIKNQKTNDGRLVLLKKGARVLPLEDGSAFVRIKDAVYTLSADGNTLQELFILENGDGAVLQTAEGIL